MNCIGVDVGGTTIKLGIVRNGTIIERMESPSTAGRPEVMADRIADMIRRACDLAETDRFGVACAGSVDAQTGVVGADNLGWVGVPLRNLLETRLNARVPLVNDGYAAMFSEWICGALKGRTCAVYLTLGTGIGGGVIMDGKPRRGARGVETELGHMITHADGLLCSCGAQGCFEAYASARALQRLQGDDMPVKSIIDGAKAGDPALLAVWRQYVHELGIGIISLMSIFAPEIVVLGGGISNAGAFLIDSVQNELSSTPVYRRLYSHIPVAAAHNGNDAGILGAAQFALKQEA